ncbi:hypothetical protein Tco_0917901 [Tanacetum coccineum]
MTTSVGKRNASKFCEFHGEVEHTTDECMHLKRQIEEMLKAGKLSNLIKELKQNNRKDQTKTAKKGKTSGKDKSLAILMGKRMGRKISPGGEKPDNPCSHTISRVQRRNNMAVRENIATGEDRRQGVRKIWAIPSTAYEMLNFTVVDGIVTLRNSKIILLECMMISGPGVPQPVIKQVAEEKIQVAIHPEYLEQTVAIGSTLTEEGRKELYAEHRLKDVYPLDKRKRGQAPERNKAIYEKLEKLVDADIIKEVHYHSWLSNPVMVKKHDGSWRMCVDFKYLNKACPKDGYPLPKIYWKVESLYGYPFKCFLDSYKGYHQIKMAEEDEEKTAFITSQGIFCYSKMPSD